VPISAAARVVLATDHHLKLPSGPEAAQQALVEHLNCNTDNITVCGKDDWFSPVASGSAAPKQMVVCPCSAGSVAASAHGM
ncbi:aromatic acid decarboxylase, partial [Vibrio parahaemolyticus]|nr:aromatic acid decarboxylase [Vibrio parahaemolyticus]